MVERSEAPDRNRPVTQGVTTTAVSTPRPSVWGILREAIRGSHQDYTEAPIGRAVVLLAVPMVLDLGAGKPERAEAATWKAGLYNTMCLGTVGAIFLLFAPQLINLFTNDPEVAPYGIRCLRIVAAGFLFYGYGMVLTAAFNGAGDTRTPTWINLGCMWLWELPLAWTLAHPLGFGPTGVFIAVSIAFSTLAFVSAALFSRGTWKTKRV